MKTIAQQLKIKKFPFEIKDDNGNEIYREDSIGFWWKQEFDSNGNEIYHEDSIGYWYKKEFDSNRNVIYCEYSDGYWYKQEYDSNGNLIYHENSYSLIQDNRPKTVELTLDEIASKFGINIKNLKIKK
jgi:hypothetical protein